jgi:MEDS: MEthanogen/methylotroph, DcmR Sensory domain
MIETTIAGPGLRLSNGDHVCVFCRGGERDELLVPFLTDGVLAGDRCLAVVDTSEPEDLLDALGTAGGAAHRADQLTVLASRDVYLTDRGFDMDGMLDFYGAELRGIFDAELIVGVLRTHPKAVIAGTVIDNPFYIQPEEFLRQRDN